MCNNVSSARVTLARPAQPSPPAQPGPPVVSRVVQNHPFVQERNSASASIAKPQPGHVRHGWMSKGFTGGQR